MSKDFNQEMSEAFDSILSIPTRQITVVTCEDSQPVDCDYSRILFDSNLNMFKLDKETNIVTPIKTKLSKAQISAK